LLDALGPITETSPPLDPLLILVGSLSGLLLRNLKITLRTRRPLVCLDQIKTRLRVAPLTQRQGHDNDNKGDRDGDRDDYFARPYGQRHAHA
jgi:hypothetical protein